jgi:hypothetical protein
MFIFLDTETTGTGPDDRLCQIAFKPEGGPAVCETFNPGMPISIEAMSIHHIPTGWFRGSRLSWEVRLTPSCKIWSETMITSS